MNKILISLFLVLMIVLDNSGSMKASDPDGLRFTGARLALALLDEHDSAGIIQFSTHSQILGDGMLPVQTGRSRLVKLLQPVSPDGFTDFLVALEDTKRLQQAVPLGNAKFSAIFLTDGKPEIEKPYLAYEQEILDLARSNGIPVHAIALSNNADIGFLQQLAAATGGSVTHVQKASGLLDTYLHIVGQIQDRTILTPTPGSSAIEIDPGLAPYLEKVSFVLLYPKDADGQIVSPSGEIITEHSTDVEFWLADPRFLVVTIRQPQPGEWRIEPGSNNSSQLRAILYSRLRAKIVSPGTINQAGKPLLVVAQLLEEQADGKVIKIIGDATFSATLTRPDGNQESLDQLYDDGTHGDAQSGDGDFSRLLPGDYPAGVYEIAVTGRKGPVPVGIAATFSLVQFPRLVIDLPQGEYETGGQPIPLKTHLEDGESPELDGGQVIARITAPSGKTSEVVLKNKNGEYTSEFIPAENGLHTVQFETRDASYLGLPFWDASLGEFVVHISRQVTLGKPQIEVQATCLDGLEGIHLEVPIRSLKPETLQLALDSAIGLAIQPRQVDVHAGESRLVLDILPSGKAPPAGVYRPNLLVTVSDDTVIYPKSGLLLEFAIPPLWARCQKPFSWGGLGLLSFGLVGIGIARKVRLASRPALVSGTLRWQIPGQAPIELDLTAIAKPILTIGSKSDCDVVIPGLAERHAMLLAEKTGISLQPIGAVKKGYSTVQVRFPLSHGEQFSLDGLNFHYLSDSGE